MKFMILTWSMEYIAIAVCTGDHPIMLFKGSNRSKSFRRLLYLSSGLLSYIQKEVGGNRNGRSGPHICNICNFLIFVVQSK
jgi:hypothetical protein